MSLEVSWQWSIKKLFIKKGCSTEQPFLFAVDGEAEAVQANHDITDEGDDEGYYHVGGIGNDAYQQEATSAHRGHHQDAGGTLGE